MMSVPCRTVPVVYSIFTQFPPRGYVLHPNGSFFAGACAHFMHSLSFEDFTYSLQIQISSAKKKTQTNSGYFQHEKRVYHGK